MFLGKRKKARANEKCEVNNILVVTMSLNIGGAETYIVELCKALKKRGINVFVASAGGHYVQEVEGSSIKHFDVPLNKKDPGSIIKSYVALKRIIKENNINIIHAHARIPAFICGILGKRTATRFVTTAHWLYDTRFHYRMLTNWGSAACVVSEDIKDYLINRYKFDAERILVTINAIDTEKFSPDINGQGLLNEFGMDAQRKRIVVVGRMDNHIDPINQGKIRPGVFLAALELVKAVPCLEVAYPGEIDVVILGDGDSFSELKAAAEHANKQAGRQMVVLTGPRTDVNKFLSKDFATLCIGSGRAAQEYMAAACPVILAGNEGFLGVLTKDNYGLAIESNFCCRGDFPATTADLIKSTVLHVLGSDEKTIEALGRDNREFILENRSINRMAEDNLRLYEMVARPMKSYDAVLSGYYGTGNSGDEMILTTIVDALRKKVPGARIAVLCRRKPLDTAKKFGVKTVFAFNFPAIFRLLTKTNLLISGGGTLITDITSTKSLWYYLLIIKTAQNSGSATCIYASGIGPFKNERNRGLAAKTLKNVDLITLRDELSLNEIKTMEIGINPIVTADPVFGLNCEAAPLAPLLREFGLNGGYFIVSVRSWKYLASGFVNILGGFIDYMREKHGLTAVFLSMMHNEDMEISRRIIASSQSGGVLPERCLNINEMFALTAGASVAVAMRLHAIIYAAKVGTPVVGLSYDPKVIGVMEMFGQSACVDVADFNLGELIKHMENVLDEKTAISESLLEISDNLAKKADRTMNLASSLILRSVCNEQEI
ncbi:MAG: polysaccharide pyruvyl transferase CsaB [Defluviitaleaceae bacterium]|nr:polysaccharide pyruvyl transferase CsaB [Defluviitaleaceae bacterium]